MSLDESVQGLLSALAAQGVKPFAVSSPAEVRALLETFTALQESPRDVERVVETTYPGPGGDLDLHIYVPEGQSPLPVVVYYHGGGFVGGSLAVADAPARALANDAGAIVVTVQYRLAPEHKFPAATDDTYAALRWVADHIDVYGGDRQRIAVMGDSAGGNLAAVAAIRARDEDGPALVAQVLIYPAVDPSADLPSRREFAEGYLLSAADIDWFWTQYLSGSGDALNPLASPAKSSSLAGLPPAFVLSTEYEVLRDEAEAFAGQLTEAGVNTKLQRFAGLIHGVYGITAAVPRSTEIHHAIVEFLTTRFAT